MISFFRRMGVLAGVAVVGMAAQAASAGIVIGGFAQGTVALRTDGGKTVGTSFTAVTSQIITSLGFYDEGDNGLVGSYQVGLWDAAGNLIGSGTVTTASTRVGDFRYVGIIPVVIPAGQEFTIGALLPSDLLDEWLVTPPLGLGSGFSGPARGLFTDGATLTEPTTSDSPLTYYVVNANGIGGVFAPEPGTVGVLCGGALLLGLRRKRAS
jgi:hypothetical protein